jgi:hypothetical protein
MGMREIIESLKSNRSKLYHNGMSETPLSTFSDSLNRHNPKIFEKIFYEVVGLARSISAKNNFKFKNPLKIIDASTIEVWLGKIQKNKRCGKTSCENRWGFSLSRTSGNDKWKYS